MNLTIEQLRALIKDELANVGDSMQPGGLNALPGFDPDQETVPLRQEASLGSDGQLERPVNAGESVPFEFHILLESDGVTGITVTVPGTPKAGSFTIDGGDPHPVEDFNTAVGRLTSGSHVIKGVFTNGPQPGLLRLGAGAPAAGAAATPTQAGSGTFAAAGVKSLFVIHFHQDDALSKSDTDGVSVADVDLATLIPGWDNVSTIGGNNGIWFSRKAGAIFLTYQTAGFVHKVAKVTSDLATLTWSLDILALSGLPNVAVNPQYCVCEAWDGTIMVAGAFDDGAGNTPNKLLRFSADGSTYLGATDYATAAAVCFLAADRLGNVFLLLSNAGAAAGIYLTSSAGASLSFVALPNCLALNVSDDERAYTIADFSTETIKAYDATLTEVASVVAAGCASSNDIACWGGLLYVLMFADSTAVPGVRRYTTAGVFQVEWHQTVAVKAPIGIAVTPG